MALSIQLGFPDVPKSITNPLVNKKDALDVEFPYPFLNFIRLINVSFDPDVLQSYYKEYINVWYRVVIGKPVDENAIIVQQYREFVQELALNYTTEEEKIFLTKINFNDPHDLDIAIGFFGKKLKDVTDFYNNKRHTIKLSLTKNKIRGTNLGLEKYIVELTLNHLRNLDDGKILYDYEQIQEDIVVELEELYDQYPFYFNQEPSTKYDNKDLDYGLNLFLTTNNHLLSTVLSAFSVESLQLKEIIARNPNDPTNNLFDNKERLTKANVFTDFYFLSTGNTVTDFLSGKLFESTNDIGTFLNRDFPTSATTEQSILKTPREQGFFKPYKLAIVMVDGEKDTFSFNLQNLEPNSLYFFPDPVIFGKNGEIISFTVDDTFLKKNVTSGKAVNQPTSTPSDTKYYGYVSKIDPNEQKYLDYIYDSGHIKDFKKDIYGNSFGLFTNDGLYRKGITILPTTDIIYQLWNGYVYYDLLYNEGYEFDYFTIDDLTYTETIRTGLSTNTGFFLPSPDINVSVSFGQFVPNLFTYNPTDPSLISSEIIFENAFISDTLGPYAETFSSDLSSWSTDPGVYYYSHLVENATASAYPVWVRPLVDPLYPSLTADITQFNILSAQILDGDYLGIYHGFTQPSNTPSLPESNTLLNDTEFYLISDLPAEFDGQLFVKNSNTAEVLPLLNAFPYYLSKYDPVVLTELDGSIQKFEITTDSIFIETSNYLVIDKISYRDSQFVNPNIKNITLPINTNWANRITNRFKKGSNIFYAILDTLTPSITGSVVNVFPTIYKYDSLSNANSIIYNTPTDFFVLSTGSAITNVTSPTLTYNSRNDIFRISFLGKDPSNIPTLVEYDFIYVGGVVEFLRRNIYKFSSSGYTYIFDVVPPTLNFYMQSSPITTINSEIVF